MVCPYCGTVNANPVGNCIACGKAMPIWEGAGGMPAPPPVNPILTSRLLGALGVLGVVALMALAAFVAFAKPLPPHEDNLSYRLGNLIGMVLFPLLVGAFVVAFKKLRFFNLFVLLFCVIEVFFVGVTWLFALREPHTQSLKRIFREASGLQPIRNPLFSARPAYDRVCRDIFRDAIQTNRDYMAAVNNLDTSEVNRLNEPRGIAEPQWAEKGLKQIHAAYDLDVAQETKMQAWIVQSRQSISAFLANSETRERELKDFDDSVTNFLPARQGVSTSEKAWIDAIDALHHFAQRHHSEIQLKDGKILFSSDAALNEFRTRARLVDTSYEEYMKAMEQFQKKQEGLMRKEGVNRQELGIEE